MTNDERPDYCTNPDCPGEHPPAELIKAAAAALWLAVRGERTASHERVIDIARWGTDGLAVAVHMWIDQLVENTPLRDVDPERLALSFGGTTTGDLDPTSPLHDADQVPPPVRWAGRYLMAWIRKDEDQMTALGASIENDREQTTRCVLAVLDMCGLMLRNPNAIVRAGGGG